MGDRATLVMIPTYRERGNVEPMSEEILGLGLELDLLFVDDASPDGTGEILDAVAARESRVRVLHRPAKLGIGSAHQDGIRWAYEKGYRNLVTLDCDFTHPPRYIPELLKAGESCDIVVGSRYLEAGSLEDWPLFRIVLTRIAHALTRRVLGLPYDATAAYRLYRLDRVPRESFSKVKSQSYAFFFESLYVLHRLGLKIREIPVVLPGRAKEQSKMTPADMLDGVWRLLCLRMRGQ